MCRLTSLDASTTYYYKAYVLEWNESKAQFEERFGSEMSFTTAAPAPSVPAGWLELPAYTTSGMSGTTTSSLSDLYYLRHKATMGGKTQRNYTCLYDPDVPQSKQTNCIPGAYGVSLATENYANNLYSRGHQIANADRNGSDGMCDQTYYMTNITPQIQNGFNGGIWNNLEGAVQGLVSSCDTVYVVTGAAFRKKGGSETIKTIKNSRDNKILPVPNYYWKALLKVKRSGGTVTQASAIGFWLPHADLQGQNYTSHVVSVDQIETWTGFDFFSNLPGDNSSGIERLAESNTNWTTFRNF